MLRHGVTSPRVYTASVHHLSRCGGAEIARLDNAAPDLTDLNGFEHPSPKKKSNVLNDKRIKSCLSRLDSGAYSRLQCLRAVSHSAIRSPYTAAGRQQQQQQQQRGRRREQAVACASSANFRGVGIGNGSRGNNLERLLQSVHRGATCWLRTGAVRT